jgi:hypothetical protein
MSPGAGLTSGYAPKATGVRTTVSYVPGGIELTGMPASFSMENVQFME